MRRIQNVVTAAMVMVALPLLGSCSGGDDGGDTGSTSTGTLTFVNNTSITFNYFFWQADTSCVGGQGTCWDDVVTGDPEAGGALPLAPGQTRTTPPFDYGEYNTMLLAENLDGTGWGLQENNVEIDLPNFVVTINQGDLVFFP